VIVLTGKRLIGLIVVAEAFGVAGCASGGSGGSGGAAFVSDHAESEPLAGVVKIVKVDRAQDGRVTYTLANISGKLQEDLAYHVNFMYDPSANSAFGIREDREVTSERDLVLLKSESAKEIVVENPRPGHVVRATTIEVQDSPPVAAVAREGAAKGTGTIFLNRALECVGMATEDEIRAGALWIEVENVSDRAVSELEAKAVFVDAMDKEHEKHGETKWTTVKDVKPGARTRIEFNIAGLGKVSNYTFLVKIRQQSL
jgi:hypothetical protein